MNSPRIVSTILVIYIHCSIVGVEVFIELLQFVQSFSHFASRIDKVGDSEVISSWPLAKSTSRHRHDSCVFEHVHAVHEVWLNSQLVSTIQGLLIKLDLRKCVHGSFNSIG